MIAAALYSDQKPLPISYASWPLLLVQLQVILPEQADP